jgi:UDP-3-O-[3-hydroxymyristoyl] N-acetylglucosamine deacetylase
MVSNFKYFDFNFARNYGVLLPSLSLLPDAVDANPCHSLRRQRTLQSSFSLSGNGLFTGGNVTIRLLPAEVGTGIVFKRIDLPGEPLISAKLENVRSALRCTQIGTSQASVQTVEHLLAALKGCEIDNILIEIDGGEVPILDGSAAPFVEQIALAGIALQEAATPVYTLTAPLYWSQGEVHLIALPSPEYRISYTLHYPNSELLGSQFYSTLVQEREFAEQIAPCRTFSLYEEIAPLIEKGLLKGSLDNGVVIRDNAVVNPEGVRFPDEMVRHKILDLIGDLSLVGVSFAAHIISIRSGHTSNCAFAKELLCHMNLGS